MLKEETKIKIPDNGEVKIKIPDTGGSLSIDDLKKDADSKFKDVNYILLSVIIILLVMVATLLIDSFHFNSVTYKEYSQKTEAVETTQKINQQLLEQGVKNQQMIIDLQNQLLNKK